MTDVWHGKQLQDAEVAWETIHYRVHDAETGALLGFGSAGGDGALMATVRHFLDVQAQHPDRQLMIRRYDQPA
ncbi:hypothetical protein [Streptomyces sp. NPDC048248]|uniref:hypothetical protein n=1 Tax=Streptomyces sp. NPDC048248 TaxID=3365523 RepID=UPI003721F05B